MEMTVIKTNNRKYFLGQHPTPCHSQKYSYPQPYVGNYKSSSKRCLQSYLYGKYTFILHYFIIQPRTLPDGNQIGKIMPRFPCYLVVMNTAVVKKYLLENTLHYGVVEYDLSKQDDTVLKRPQQPLQMKQEMIIL